MSGQVLNIETIYLWIEMEKEKLEKQRQQLKNEGNIEGVKQIENKLIALRWLKGKVTEIMP